MPTLRTLEGKNKYKKYRENHVIDGSCEICSKEAIVDFKNWKIVNNDFPYDLVADVHHMLVTKRHADEHGLNTEEKNEMEEIKFGYVNENYDYIIEATVKNKSIPAHFHLHLIVAKVEV